MATNKDFNIRLRTKGDKKAKRALGGVTSSIKSMVGTVASVYTLKKGFDATIKAAAEQEKIFKGLQTAVENTGKSWDSAKGELDSMFASLQATTEYGDTESAQMLQSLIEYTGDYETATENMSLLTDMASSSMFNQQSAARYLGQALAGNVSTLGRYIPELRTANNEQLKHMDTAEKAEYAQKLLNEKFGGTAQENLDTVTGQYKQMKNYLGDMGEAIGDKVLPGMNSLLKSTVNWMQSISQTDLEENIDLMKQYGAEIEKINEFTATNVMIESMKERRKLQKDLNDQMDTFSYFISGSEDRQQSLIQKEQEKLLLKVKQKAGLRKEYELNKSNWGLIKRMNKSADINALEMEVKTSQVMLNHMQGVVKKQKKIQGLDAKIVQSKKIINGETEQTAESTNKTAENMERIFVPLENAVASDYINVWIEGVQELSTNLKTVPSDFVNIITEMKKFDSTWNDINVEIDSFWKSFQGGVQKASSVFSNAFVEMADTSKDSFVIMRDAFTRMLEQMAAEVLAKSAIWGLMSMLPGGGAAYTGFTSLGGFLFGSHGGIVDKDQIQYYKTGGLSRGSDTVPAMLTPGEMVLNTDQQKELFNLAKGEGETTNNQEIHIHGNVIGEERYIDKLAEKINYRSKRGFNKIAVT